MDYQEFLKTKVPIGKLDGFEPTSGRAALFDPNNLPHKKTVAMQAVWSEGRNGSVLFVRDPSKKGK